MLRHLFWVVFLPLILVACDGESIPGGQSVNAPSVTLRTPLEGASVELADLLVEGSVSNAAASVEVVIVLDDATYSVSTSAHPGFSAMIPAAELSPGAHTITATATDADGLTASTSVHITVIDDAVDTAAPSVTITNPVNGTTLLPGVITISGTASDDFGLEAVEISIDGAAAVSVTGLENWDYNWDASSASLGTHTFTVTARDRAANESQAEISITLNESINTPGVINILTQSHDVDEDTGSVTFVVERSRGTEGAVSVEWTTVDQTAEDQADYLGNSAVFNWADGEGGQKQVSIPILDDTDPESSEYFNFRIENPQGGVALGNDTNISITINANDSNENYFPPVGIPAPTFGINESHQMYAGQTYAAGGFIYKDAGNGPYTHYVDRTASNCDDANVGGYGDAANPRCGIPTTLAAGSVIEVHGSGYSSRMAGKTQFVLTLSGTSSNPIFFRGIGNPQLNAPFQIDGKYTIVEGFYFNNVGSQVPYAQNGGYGTSRYISFRNNEFAGNGQNGHGSVLGVATGDENNPVENIVIFNNYIHDYGDSDYTGENDYHAISPGVNSRNIWILYNHVHDMGGDSVQVRFYSSAPNLTPQYIYIGGNEFHDDGENAVDLKGCLDVIVSQNKMYNYDGFSGDKGPASITSNHYDTPSSNVAKRVWYVFNEMYDSEMANVVSSGPDEIYFIGNKIHGITEGPAFNSWGSYNIHILNNVVSNSISGLSISGGDGTHYLRLKGNIFTDLVNQDYVILSNSGYSSRADISNNVFYSSMGIPNVDGNSLNEINLDPLLNADSSLQSFSPAIDTGIEADAYQTFENTYGLNIRVGFDGNARPVNGADWDIGAFEYGSSD
ncbi:MAG: Ig-like domain-containing protein [Candidatus Thiodiazotropha sp.]